MKKVKMLVSIASADWSYAPQQTVELEDFLADAWVEAGHAVHVGGVVVEKKDTGNNSSDIRNTKSSRGKKTSES